MEERARITRVEALESFRSSLIVYISKARPALEEVSAEMLRLRGWLDEEHRLTYQQIRRKQLIRLEQARSALSNAQLSNPEGGADEERMAVRRAREAVEATEMKLRRARMWSRDFESQVDPLTRQLDHLLHLLTTDLQRGVASLTRTIRTLSHYTDAAIAEPTEHPEAAEAGPSPSPSPETPS